MPVADTELLFLLNPNDPRYKYAIKIIEEYRGNIYVPDVALFEFEIVLRSRGVSVEDIKTAFKALRKIFSTFNIKELKCIDTALIINHLDLMNEYGLSFFDSLIASAALSFDGIIVSDDSDFDRVGFLRRIPITYS